MKRVVFIILSGICLVVLAISFVPFDSIQASEPEAVSIITKITPSLKFIEEPEKDWEIFSSNYYEYSDVSQNSRAGSWWENTNLLGFARKNIKGYFSVTELSRFGERDNTANFGAYLTMKNSYMHFETGFGWDIDYIYRLQQVIEYAHKMYKGLYWQAGYNYRAYSTGDTQLIYPGLIYYFGNSYIGANYGCSIIQHRGTGNMGSIKGNFTMNKYVDFWVGGAVGQWLYDINGLPASQEFGYLGLAGVTFHLNKNVAVKFGYSYGHENPDFIKRGVTAGVDFKF